MQKLNHKQSGIVLIVFTIILALAAIAYFIKISDPVALQAARDDKNAQFLAQAKQALISHSVSRALATERPGDMPRPDYFPANELPLLNYDGNSETGCVEVDALNLPITPLNLITTGNLRCLGRLPWRSIGLTIPNPSENDIAGSMPWYAVSANLVDPTCLAALNPNTLNLVNNPPPAPLDCSGLTLPYPWLTVIDSAGHILSSQVAAVIMLPGSILTGQSRPAAPLGGVTNYLDTVTVPAGCVGLCVPAGVYSNADFDNIFVIPPQVNAASTASDRLVYITMQELMTKVERRATQEAAVQLKRYYTNSNAVAANRFYPYAANLGDVNNACVNSNLAGFISVRPASANCTSVTSCSVSFPTTEVEFELTSGNYTSRTGSCSIAGDICTCEGVGSCNKSSVPASSFSCNAAGLCQSVGTNPNGFFTFNFIPKTPDVSVVSGNCAINALGRVICNDAGTFSSPPTNCTHANPGISTLATWFIDNNWQNFIYYRLSTSCTAVTSGCLAANLTVGARGGVHAVVIASGITLPSTEAQPAPLQARPSPIVTNYLDSLVNTDGGTPSDPANIIFDATSKMRANDYNDQPLIVAP
jgi:hypothetical protein